MPQCSEAFLAHQMNHLLNTLHTTKPRMKIGRKLIYEMSPQPSSMKDRGTPQKGYIVSQEAYQVPQSMPCCSQTAFPACCCGFLSACCEKTNIALAKEVYIQIILTSSVPIYMAPFDLAQSLRKRGRLFVVV